MLVDIGDITGSGTIKPGVLSGLIKTEQVSANRHGKYHPVNPSLWQQNWINGSKITHQAYCWNAQAVRELC